MHPSSIHPPTFLIIMGVSGCGKSTFAFELAQRLSVGFLDGDDLHPQSNLIKLNHQIPLDDTDREPWLRSLRAKAIEIIHSPSGSEHAPSNLVVIACSALKRKYRDLFRGGPVKENLSDIVQPASQTLRVCFIYLKGPPELIKNRMQARKNHFMSPAMLESQLETLEEPDPIAETDSSNLVIPISLVSVDGKPRSLDEMLDEALRELKNHAQIAPERVHETPTKLAPIQSLVNMDDSKIRFAKLKETLSLLFEVSDSIETQLIPRLTDGRCQQPIATYFDVLNCCQSIVEQEFSIQDQVTFLGSHPRIGQVKGLSKMSSKEQGNQTDPKVLVRLEELNRYYEHAYPGLRYVTFVNGRSRAEIVTEMEALLCPDGHHLPLKPQIHSQHEDAWRSELVRGIKDVFKIAQSRLKGFDSS